MSDSSSSDSSGSDSDSSGSDSDGERVSSMAVGIAASALDTEGATALEAQLQKASKEEKGKMTSWKKRWVTIGGGKLRYYAKQVPLTLPVTALQ